MEASLSHPAKESTATQPWRASPRSAQWPALSSTSERRLVVAAARGDTIAREELVQAFMPAIGTLARIYRNSPGVDHAELMQEGVVGLLRALRRYEPRMNTPFWAYASWWVRQAMQGLVADLTRPVALSDRALRAMARVKRARHTHLQAHMREPSCSELADATRLPREQVETLLSLERVPRSLEEPLGSDSSGGRTAEDMLVDPVGEDQYDEVVERVGADEVRRLTYSLDEREREVLLDHFGVDRPAQTLRQIGSQFGLSAERVRQIEEQALQGLRAALVAKGIDRGSAGPEGRCA
ncbi:MAG TPA: sigma-70 family RNA polymerase sigma factor [Solirubrobacteraceae bacterium]|jgi:RNA polymerase sigma factor (sigma-70 family)